MPDEITISPPVREQSDSAAAVLHEQTLADSVPVITPRMLRAARRDSIEHSLGQSAQGNEDSVASLSSELRTSSEFGTPYFNSPFLSDSLAVDSMAKVLHDIYEPPFSTENDAPHQFIIVEKGSVNYFNGIEGVPRPELLGYNSGVMSILLAVFLCIALTFHNHTTFLKTFTQDLWSVRKRSNVFEDHTVSETQILASLIMLVCVCEGVVLFSFFQPMGIPGGMFGSVSLMVGLAAVYYLWQLAAYSVTGYAFTDPVLAGRWIRGFNASQALLGLALAPPALWVAFNPGAWYWVGPVSVLLYLIARIIFICKGFRIFYDKFSSLVYFILYLCTLEIVPLVIIFRVCRLFQTL